MPNSFANDGAFGAGGPGMSTAPVPGQNPASTTGTPSSSAAASQSATGTSPPGASQVPAAWMANGALNGLGGVYSQNPATNAPPGSDAANFNASLASAPANSSLYSASFFAAGGAVPDDNGASQQQDPASDTLQQALGSANQALQMVYKQFGLGGDQSQAGGVQEAVNMPTVPAGQSETGIPPQRPAPGPLPPTSNPFGKRAGIQDDETQGAA